MPSTANLRLQADSGFTACERRDLPELARQLGRSHVSPAAGGEPIRWLAFQKYGA